MTSVTPVGRRARPNLAALFATLLAATTAPAHAADHQGIVQPSRVVTLKAPLDERLDELPVAQADRVAAGQPVARMADDVQQATVAVARHLAEDDTSLRIATLAVEDAEIRHRRLTQAFDNDAANELELLAARVAADRARAELEAAQRQIHAAQLRLELEQKRLDRHLIPAPFDGVVSQVLSEQGASLTRDDPVLELIALDPLEASFDLPDHTYGRLAVGDSITLLAATPVDRQLQAVVDRLVPRIDPGSRTYRVILRINNPDQRLPAGFVVTLTLDEIPPNDTAY